MVARATIIAKVNYGLGKGGAVLGYPIAQYRPSGTTTPIVSGNLVGTVTGDFDSHPALDFTQQPKIGAFQFYLLGDPTGMLAGDYLVGQGAGPGEAATYFVAAVGGVEPAMCIKCTLTISVLRQPAQTGVGALPYGGDLASAESTVMSDWPASVLETKRNTGGDTKLPGDDPMPWWDVLLPAVAGVPLMNNDVLIDDLGRRYRVAAAEQEASGWRLHTILTQT